MTKAATRHALGAWILAGMWAAVTCAAASPPEQQVDQDFWYVVHMQGQQCGYMHTTTRRVGDEVNSHTFMQFEIARGPTKLKISMDQTSQETIAGKPLGFRHKMTMGAEPTTTSGTIKDGKLTLVTEQFGVERQAAYDFDPEIKFPWGLALEQRKRGFEPGTTYLVKTYEPSLKADGPIVTKIEVRDKEEIEVLGKKRELTRVTATLQLAMPIPSETWVDDQANVIVTTINMGIMEVRIQAATKQQALGHSEAPELFFNTFVHTKRGIPSRAKGVKLRLRVPTGKGQSLPDLPQTSMQTIKRIGDREVVLTIRRLDWKKLRAAGDMTKAQAKKMKRHLGASTVCDIDDKKVKRLASRAVKGSSTPAEKADALRRFVTDYVNDKGLDVAFATASEVARSRKGDCSEHAVLLAALARAAGLPARGVSGIVQIPEGSSLSGKTSAFGYHMWTQVYLDGRWVDIDAALRQTDCDPTHIALTVMPLDDQGMLEGVMALLPLIGRLEIEVLDIEE